MVTSKTKRMWCAWIKTGVGPWYVSAMHYDTEEEMRTRIESLPDYCESVGDAEGAARWRETKYILVPVEIPIPEEVRNGDR